MRKFELAVVAAIALTGGLGTVWADGGVTLRPGDIVVALPSALGPQGCCPSAIVHVDPVTGAQTVLTLGGLFAHPFGVAVTLKGEIFVTDPFATSGPAVIRVDPGTGAQTVLASGGYLNYPYGITIAADGSILVVDLFADSGSPPYRGAVIRIDPVTGAQTILSSRGSFRTPIGIAIAPDGDLFVADYGLGEPPLADGAIIRVDPMTGEQAIVSVGRPLLTPVAIVVDQSGAILVAQPYVVEDNAVTITGAILRIDPGTGAQTIAFSGGQIGHPFGMAWAPDGKLLVADSTPRAIIQIDPNTGAQTIISSQGYMADLSGIAVVPELSPNHPPLANAGANQTVDEGASVALSAIASSDPDGDPLTYAWRQVSGTLVTLSGAGSVSPTFTAPMVPAAGDTLVFELTVSDPGALRATATVSVTVLHRNPVCGTAQALPNTLWPPNHELLPVQIARVAAPGEKLAVTAVTQDEPVNGSGDGDTTPDAVVRGPGVLLRAERAGLGNGRVYHVSFSVTDAVGGACTGTVEVAVPHSPNRQAVDDPQRYDSLQP